MKTILYNTNTNKIRHHARQGYYLVDGIRPQLPAHIAELEVVTATPPAYNPETHKLTGGQWQANLSEGTYTQVWQVVALTAEEIAEREWKHNDFSRKLWVHGSVLFTALGVAYRNYLEDKGYPVEMQADGSYLVWLNDIEASHQPFIDGLKAQNLLTETLKA